MLAQMLHPGFDQEGLDHAPFLGGVLEHAPGIGAVAAALVLELRQRFEKSFAVADRMRYSTVTRTGPRSCSIACAVIGAGQCIDGVRSTPAPVCSFHRQVSANRRRTAPAAARKCAAGKPTSTATSPQPALPSVRQPKNTVV